MEFRYIILFVDDVRESLAFYQRAFGFSVYCVDEEGDWGELDTGTTRLSFSSRRLMASSGTSTTHADSARPCFEIAFTVDDVPAALRRATEAGARLVQSPRQTPWGQTVAYVADPDDVLVEICTPISS